MSIFAKRRHPPSHSPQERYEQCFQQGGRSGAFGVMRVAEETGEWPPDRVLEWAVRQGGLSQTEVLRLAGAVMRGAGRGRIDRLYALVISEWTGDDSLVDALMTLSLKVGVRPSAAALEDGLKELRERHPQSAAAGPILEQEIERRLGAPVRPGLFGDSSVFGTDSASDLASRLPTDKEV